MPVAHPLRLCAPEALWFPVRLLDYLGQVSFCILFYVFPNGRFVPRWSRWLAIAVALLWVPDIFFPGSALDLLGGLLFLVFWVAWW